MTDIAHETVVNRSLNLRFGESRDTDLDATVAHFIHLAKAGVLTRHEAVEVIVDNITNSYGSQSYDDAADVTDGILNLLGLPSEDAASLLA